MLLKYFGVIFLFFGHRLLRRTLVRSELCSSIVKCES